MALSNIFREPRREITETLVGVAAFALPVYGEWRLSLWIQADFIIGRDPIPLFIAMMGALILSIMGGLILLGISVAVHEVGDAVCNILAERGLELRPKIRPSRR